MKKYSNYAFWVGLASAVVIFLEDIERLIGIDINTSLIESLILSFCGILVVLGIVVKDKNDIDTMSEDKSDTEVDSVDSTEQNVEDLGKD